MKKILIGILAPALLYSYFRELNTVKVLLILGGLAAVYGVSRLPARFVMAAKYPLILLSFCGTAGFFLYPNLAAQYPVEPVIIFLSFYSITFYLVTMEEKGKALSKEIVALSVLFLSSCFNLIMTERPVVILPMAFSIIFFLFILGRNRIALFIGGYTLILIIGLVFNRVTILGPGTSLSEVNRYILLAASFIFLAMSFLGFAKDGSKLKILTFFGFLYVCVDLFMATGLRLSTGLLHYPTVALIMVIPLIGLMLKEEGKRI